MTRVKLRLDGFMTEEKRISQGLIFPVVIGGFIILKLVSYLPPCVVRLVGRVGKNVKLGKKTD